MQNQSSGRGMTDGHLFNNISLGGRGGTVSSLTISLLTNNHNYFETLACSNPISFLSVLLFETLISILIPTLSVFWDGKSGV